MATIETEVGTPAKVLERIPTEDDVSFIARTLDKANPEWAQKLNPDTLDLHTARECVLGQVYGDWEAGRAKMEREIGAALFSNIAFPRGTDGTLAVDESTMRHIGVFHHNRHLPRWREEIEARR